MADAARVFTSRLALTDGFTADVSALRAPRGRDDLAGRVGFLMISIKNRLFTRRLIEAYCQVACDHLQSGCITVVDRPYINNVVALNGDPSTAARRVAGIRRLSEDRRQQTRKIVERCGRERVAFVSWEELVAATPSWLTMEVEEAFGRDCAFRSDVLEQTRRMSPGASDAASVGRRALFLVEETPVLVYTYYLFRGGVADFYPGELAEYFWRLERGDYADDLPRTTEVARSHAGLIYVDFRDQGRGANLGRRGL